MQTRTSGGVREMLVNELRVMPCGRPSAPTTVVTVTPVGNLPQTRRKSFRSKQLSFMSTAHEPQRHSVAEPQPKLLPLNMLSNAEKSNLTNDETDNTD